MKRILTTLIVLFTVICKSYGQSNYAADSASAVDHLKTYLSNHIRYPVAAQESKVSGQVIVAFWLDSNKNITDIEVLKGLNDENKCEDQVIRYLRQFSAKALKLNSDEYVFSVLFARHQGAEEDAPEINDYDRAENIIGNYKNYLFETKVHGYGFKTVTDYMVDVSYITPSFNEHNGKVKTLEINAYKTRNNGVIAKDSLDGRLIEKFNNMSSIIERTRYSGKLDRQQKDLYRYNSKGDLIELASYRGNSLVKKTINKYDAHGKKNEEINYQSPNIDNISSRKVFEFDTLGRKVKELTYRSPKNNIISSRKTFKFDNNSLNIVEEEIYNDKNELKSRHTYKYVDGIKKVEEDEEAIGSGDITFKYFNNGLISQSQSYSAKNGAGVKTIYKYDNGNRVIDEALYKPSGELLLKNIYKFDNKGNKVEEATSITDSNQVGIRSTFEYSAFDNHGNWHKVKWFNGNDKKSYVVERTITYQ